MELIKKDTESVLRVLSRNRKEMPERTMGFSRKRFEIKFSRYSSLYIIILSAKKGTFLRIN